MERQSATHTETRPTDSPEIGPLPEGLYYLTLVGLESIADYIIPQWNIPVKDFLERDAQYARPFFMGYDQMPRDNPKFAEMGEGIKLYVLEKIGMTIEEFNAYPETKAA